MGLIAPRLDAHDAITLARAASYTGAGYAVRAGRGRESKEEAAMNTGVMIARRSRTILACAAVMICLITAPLGPVRADTPPAPVDPGYLTTVGSVGGPTRGVFVRGNLAYVAVGARLLIADVSDPARPRRLGSVTLPDDALSVVVDGRYAYVSSSYYGGLRIIDVGDPTAPREVATWPGGTRAVVGWSDEIVVRDGLAYLLWSTAAWTVSTCYLRILDVSDPTAPRLVSDYLAPDGWWPGSGIALAGNLAFLAGGYNGLRIVDISDPTAPHQVGSVPARGFVGDVFVAGAYAFIIEDGVVQGGRYRTDEDPDVRPGIRVLDVSRPTEARSVAFLPTDGQVRDMVVIGDTLVLTEHDPGEVAWDSAGGVRIVSVRDPKRPRSVAYYPFPAQSGIGDGVLFAAPGGRLFVTGTGIVNRDDGVGQQRVDVYNGLWMLDVSHAAESLPVIGQVTDAGFETVADVATSRGLIYAAAGEDGLRVIAPSNPGGPLDIGGLDLGVPAEGIVVEGDHAYATSERGALSIVGLADPVAPVITGHLAGRNAGGTSDTVVSRDRAFIGVRGEWIAGPDGSRYAGGGLRVVDVSDPRAPRETAWIPLEHVTQVALAGDVLLVTDGATLWKFDLQGHADPPPQIGSWVSDVMIPDTTTRLGIVAIAGEGTTAYVAVGREDPPWTYRGGLVVLDLTGRTAPRKLSYTPFTESSSGIAPQALTASEGTVFVSQHLAAYKYYGWPHRLDAIDVSDPNAPVTLSTLYGFASFTTLAVDEDRVIAGGRDVDVFHAGNSVRGLVVDGVGRPVAGAHVGRGRFATATGSDGAFTFNALPAGTHALGGADPRFAFRPPERHVTVPPDRTGVRFVVQPVPVSAAVPGLFESVTLTYTDTQGLPTDIVYPAAVVTFTTQVTVTAANPPGFPDGTRYAAHAFTVSAERDGRPVRGIDFAWRAAVTIRYSDADAWAITDEVALDLVRLDGRSWATARAGCGDDLATTVDPAANVIETFLCRAGTYAVVGPTRQVVLPLVLTR
jgi:hypothetical protein